MELEEPAGEFKLEADKRPTMPQPPPVRVVAVEDVHLLAVAGLEPKLDAFYVGMLKFERDPAPEGQITYKAENVCLIFKIVEPPRGREDMRINAIEIPLLAIVRQQLIDEEVEFESQRGVISGQETILLKDPAGNWVQIGQITDLR